MVWSHLECRLCLLWNINLQRESHWHQGFRSQLSGRLGRKIPLSSGPGDSQGKREVCVCVGGGGSHRKTNKRFPTKIKSKPTSNRLQAGFSDWAGPAQYSKESTWTSVHPLSGFVLKLPM